MYNLTIRKCTSPPRLAPRLKIFKWKFTTPPRIEPRTHWTRGRHATIWASAASSSARLAGIWKHEKQTCNYIIRVFKADNDNCEIKLLRWTMYCHIMHGTRATGLLWGVTAESLGKCGVWKIIILKFCFVNPSPLRITVHVRQQMSYGPSQRLFTAS